MEVYWDACVREVQGSVQQDRRFENVQTLMSALELPTAPLKEESEVCFVYCCFGIVHAPLYVSVVYKL